MQKEADKQYKIYDTYDKLEEQQNKDQTVLGEKFFFNQNRKHYPKRETIE